MALTISKCRYADVRRRVTEAGSRNLATKIMCEQGEMEFESFDGFQGYLDAVLEPSSGRQRRSRREGL